jgi:hypothetical protein
VGQDLFLERAGQVVLVVPALLAGPLGERGRGLADARRLQRLGQVGDLAGGGHR